MVDASVLANAIGDDGVDGRRARRELRDADDVAAPDLVDVDTVAVLRKRWLAGTLSEHRFADAIDDLEAIELDRYPTLPLAPRSCRTRAPGKARESGRARPLGALFSCLLNPKRAGAGDESRLLAIFPAHGEHVSREFYYLSSPGWHANLLRLDNDAVAHIQELDLLSAAFRPETI